MRRSRVLAIAATLALTGGAVVTHTTTATADEAGVAVDFTKPTARIATGDIGVTITGYGGLNYIVNSEDHRKALAAHGFDTMRIELRYQTPGDHDSKIICGGDSCHTDYDGDTWMDAIRDKMNATPILVVPADADDAVSLYEHFAATGTVPKVVVGNELDAGNPPRMDAATYAGVFNEIATRIHAADASVRVGGPGTAHNNIGYLRTFLEKSAQHVDFVDFHDYGMGETRLPDEQLLAEVANYERDIAEVRALIDSTVPNGADVGIQIGEWNMDHGDKSPACSSMTSHLPTVWGAAALGTMLESEATALLFGDKNGCLGLTGEWGEGQGEDFVDINKPMPISHGVGMFTGAGLFRPFGTTMVATSTSDELLYVFASADDKNIVVVNTATTETSTAMSFTGLDSGTAEVWQSTNARRAPHRAGTADIADGGMTATLPARSVTTFVVG